MNATRIAASSVTVITSQYKFTHGGMPKGRGLWMFFYSEGSCLRTFSFNGLYSEAKREAVKVAASAGSYTVKVAS